METDGLERNDGQTTEETPEDVAILYSWANLQGAKYRDFSANRREHRAQMRHRAAERLRLMALRAQSEAEAAAAQAEAERQAARYHDLEAKSRQRMAEHAEGPVPGPLTDPYSLRILPEGEYYDGPATPTTELPASRFRAQRQPIERATGAELPPFRMPEPGREPPRVEVVLRIPGGHDDLALGGNEYGFGDGRTAAYDGSLLSARAPRAAAPPTAAQRQRISPPNEATAPGGSGPTPPVPVPAWQAFPAQASTVQASTVQASTHQVPGQAVASRWFALKGVFARPEAAERPAPREKSRPALDTVPTVAVFSLAGGVGKTSLVATLGRALSSLGEKVLLADTTSHGLLPFYFGGKEPHPGVVRTFAPPHGSPDAPVSMVSYSLDAPDAPDATGANRDKARRRTIDDLLASSEYVDRVLIDLGPSCAWIVDRLAAWNPMVLVPLAADMNSVLSLQAVEMTFSAMRDADGGPLRPVYLMNQFDESLPLHLDVRELLRQQLGDRLLPRAVRRAAGVSEALAEGMTIVDYDPDSSAAQDFLGLANWIRAISAPATRGFRTLRWSERWA